MNLLPELCNPFIVASCHFTGNERVLKSLNKFFVCWNHSNGFDPYPGALILKSVSDRGGDGLQKPGVKRDIWHDDEYTFLRYSDGPKKLELLKIDIACRLVESARRIFPLKTKIGGSVLAGEKNSLKNIIKLQSAGVDFIELNTKYLSRKYIDAEFYAKDKAEQSYDFFIGNIKNILNNATIPVWIKFARDIIWLRNKEMSDFSNNLSRKDISFVIANTQQVYIHDNNKTKDGRAIIYGKNLFPITFDMIKHIRNIVNEEIPLIASGGVTTFKQTKALLENGAEAIEYCVFFQDGNRDFSTWKYYLSEEERYIC